MIPFSLADIAQLTAGELILSGHAASERIESVTTDSRTIGERALFIALAADDPFFANGGYGLIDSWKAAKRPVEFHLFEQGGHGFGMYPKETTSTGWFPPVARGRPRVCAARPRTP